MPDSTPNQYLPPVVSGQAQSSSEINIITGTDGGTTDLGADAYNNVRELRVIPPASGTHTITLPPLYKWKNETITLYQIVSAPGGAVEVVDAETATSVAGDTITAANDHIVVKNLQGEDLLVIKEVTT